MEMETFTEYLENRNLTIDSELDLIMLKDEYTIVFSMIGCSDEEIFINIEK